MIYLIITTSINNMYSANANGNERQSRYLYAISETLKYLPQQIKPIIVENNGKRKTYLDNFYHYNGKVNVIYTDNNQKRFKSKGTTELLDIKEVIEQNGIHDDDIIIKITGRYRALSSDFFNDIITNDTNETTETTETKYDAFVKFYNVCSLKFEDNDCVLGCYAIRAKYLKMFNPYSIENYQSAERGFARYIRLCGARLKEISELHVECCFSEDLRILNV